MKWVTAIIPPILGFATAYFMTVTNMRSGETHDEQFQAIMLPIEIIQKFEQLAFDEYQPAEAVIKYFSEDVIEHDPNVIGTKASIVERLERLDWTNGNGPKREIKLMMTQDDLVMVFYHLVREPGTRGMAAVDIFRVKDGLVIEHWDVQQDIPEDSLNLNTMF